MRRVVWHLCHRLFICPPCPAGHNSAWQSCSPSVRCYYSNQIRADTGDKDLAHPPLLCRPLACVAPALLSLPPPCNAVTIFTEFLPADKRALFIVLINVFWSVGSIIEAALAWIIMPITSIEDGWRILIGVSCFPLLIVMFMWPVLPQSPRYNLIKGRPERIEPVFRMAFKSNGKEYPEDIQLDLSVNTSDFDEHSHKGGNICDLFKGPHMYATILLPGRYLSIYLSVAMPCLANAITTTTTTTTTTK